MHWFLELRILVFGPFLRRWEVLTLVRERHLDRKLWREELASLQPLVCLVLVEVALVLLQLLVLLCTFAVRIPFRSQPVWITASSVRANCVHLHWLQRFQ